jgi:hypothetical protein
MKVSGEGLTLTSLMQATENSGEAKKLLSKKGEEVHTHSSWKLHRSGESAQQRRLEKAENGVEMVKKAITKEFGHIAPDIADRVFQAVNTRHGKDLSTTMRVGDLKLVQQEAERLASVGDDIRLLLDASGPFKGMGDTTVTGAVVERLLDAHQNPNTPQDLRDGAVKALAKFLTQNSDDAAVLKEAFRTPGINDAGQPYHTKISGEAVVALFKVADSDGAQLLSDDDQRNITMTLIKDELSTFTGNEGGMLRGATPASKALAACYSVMDGGILPALGKDILEIAKSSDSLAAALPEIDKCLMTYSKADMTELNKLFVELASVVDDTNLSITQAQDNSTALEGSLLSGSSFVSNSTLLRVVVPMLTTATVEMDAAESKVIKEVSQTLMKATKDTDSAGMSAVANEQADLAVAFKHSSEGFRAFREALI